MLHLKFGTLVQKLHAIQTLDMALNFWDRIQYKLILFADCCRHKLSAKILHLKFGTLVPKAIHYSNIWIWDPKLLGHPLMGKKGSFFCKSSHSFLDFFLLKTANSRLILSFKCVFHFCIFSKIFLPMSLQNCNLLLHFLPTFSP